MKHIHQVVFDFDYTLADSSEGIIASVNHALTQIGEKTADPAAVRQMIGHSLEDTFAKFVDPSDANKIQTCKKLFLDFADNGIMVKNTVILQEVEQTLGWLYENFYTMGIVSTKGRSTIESILAHHDLEDFFDVILGYEDVKELKPNPEGLLRAVEELGGNKIDTVYVGDSVIDIQTAKNAGVSVIAIASGMTTAEILRAKSPEVLIRSFGELQKLFDHSKQ